MPSDMSCQGVSAIPTGLPDLRNVVNSVDLLEQDKLKEDCYGTKIRQQIVL